MQTNLKNCEFQFFIPPTIPSAGKFKIDMSNKLPIDFFKVLVILDILDNIVRQTNVYAIQFYDKNSAIQPRSRLHFLKKTFLAFQNY